MGVPANYLTEFDEKCHARVFVDLGMQQTSQLLQVSSIERNYILGMQHSKIGAKTTMDFQPIGLGKISKCVKFKIRSTSMQVTDCLLRKSMIT